VVLAGHQGLEAVLGHLGRVVLVGLGDLGVVHAGPVEELGVGRPRLERGHGDPGVLELVPDGLGERLEEGLGGGVGGVVGTGHGGGHRGGDQHPAGAPLHHGRQHPLGQVHHRGHVDGDQLQVVLQGGVPGEVAVHADAGVEGHGVKGPPARGHRRPEPLDPVVGRQVGLDHPDLDAAAGQADPSRLTLPTSMP
jgi:hypothetical protein